MSKTVFTALGIAFTMITLVSANERSARADDTKGRVTELAPTIIYGKAQVPVAAVEVSKIAPKVSLAELRQPFLDRVAGATRHDPF